MPLAKRWSPGTLDAYNSPVPHRRVTDSGREWAVLRRRCALRRRPPRHELHGDGRQQHPDDAGEELDSGAAQERASPPAVRRAT